MAVSYLSKTYNSNPYVLPISLDIMAKVLSYKQDKYDQNAQKIQDEINTFGSFDVIKPEDRQYLNGKINNLVNNVNSLGGVDLSDQSIANQVESLGGDIYGDNKIITALASTKQVRSVINGYEKMKTDPKLIPFYSAANEDYDINNPMNSNSVRSYLSNNKVGSSYQGANAPSPYQNYHKFTKDITDKIKGDYFESVTQKGLYISKTSGDVKTSSQIQQEIANQLPANMQDQIKKDALFAIRQNGVTPVELIQKRDSQYNDRLNEAQGNYKMYMDIANQSISNPQQRAHYIQLANEQQQYAQQTSLERNNFQKNAATIYQSNPEKFAHDVYLSDYLKGVGDASSINKFKNDIKPDMAAIATQKMSQEQSFHKDEMVYKNADLGVKYADLELKAREHGLDMTFGPTGTPIFVVKPLPLSPSNMTPDGKPITENTFRDEISQIGQQKIGIIHDFLDNLKQHDASLFETLQSGESAFDIKLKGQESLENGTKGLSEESIKNFDEAKYRQAAQKTNLSKAQIDYVTNSFNDLKAAMLGHKTPQEINPEFVSKMRDFTILDLRQNALLQKENDVTNQIIKNAGLTPDEEKQFRNYSKILPNLDINHDALTIAANPGEYFYTQIENIFNGTFGSDVPSNVSNYDPVLKQALQKIKKSSSGKSYQDLREQYYTPLDKQNYYGRKIVSSLNKGDNTDSEPVNLAVNILKAQGSITDPKATYSDIAPSNINLVDVGHRTDGKPGYSLKIQAKVGTKDGVTSFKDLEVPITIDQAQYYGIDQTPNQGQLLNTTVQQTGKAEGLIFNAGTGVANISIIKANNNPNDQTVIPQIKIPIRDKSGNPIPGQFVTKQFPLNGQSTGNSYSNAAELHDKLIRYFNDPALKNVNQQQLEQFLLKK